MKASICGVGWRLKVTVGMRTARRLRRRKINNDKDAKAVEMRF